MRRLDAVVGLPSHVGEWAHHRQSVSVGEGLVAGEEAADHVEGGTEHVVGVTAGCEVVV